MARRPGEYFSGTETLVPGTTKVLAAIAGSAMALAVGIGPAAAATTPAGSPRPATGVTTAPTRQAGPRADEWYVYDRYNYSGLGMFECTTQGQALVDTGTDGITRYYCIGYPPVSVDLYVYGPVGTA